MMKSHSYTVLRMSLVLALTFSLLQVLSACRTSVAPDGERPVASFTASVESGLAPLDISFDANGSSDPDGSIVSYTWNFSGSATATGITAAHRFETPGTYKITLTVKDNDNNETRAEKDIQVFSDTRPEPLPEGKTVTLPIEVLGPDGYSETVTFDLNNADGIDTLYLQCHRCGYRDGTVNTTRGAKGSVRLNGGDWVDLEDTTATVQEPEKSYGGLSGGFHTIRFTVPIMGAGVGENTLEFRFNGTDGFTSGYRILDFNLRRGSANVLAADLFKDDNPRQWTAPLTSQTDIAAGKNLWETKVLNESPVSGKKLRATCSSCHAADGRDLKYFNYSNWSIEARSMFHGLSELEGKQIASYIRSLSVPAPAQARPWNPPYQPGPGLDSKPVEEWAAGAGLEAVLESDREMLPYLFPNGTSETEIAKVASIKGTLNIRELPVSIQLPDWNAWLPEVHPLDIWGDAFANSDATRAYNELIQKLDSNAAGMVQDRSVIAALESFMQRSWRAGFSYMNGPIPCIIYANAKRDGTVKPSLMDALPAGKTCEDGLQALNPWLAVKNWEVFQTYGLENDTASLYPYGEKRGWFGKERNVFEVASHRTANNSHNFTHQSYALGSYHSNSWYHVQLILNAGNRDPYTWFPQDWFYTPMFIALNSRDNDEPLALLLTAMQIKMYQNLDMTGPDGKGVDRGADYNGWWLPFVTPWRFESALGWEGPHARWNTVATSGNPSKGFPWTQLDSYESGLRVKVTNTFLREFLTKQKSYPVQTLERRGGTVTDTSYFEAADYVLPANAAGTPPSCYYPCPGESGQALPIYRALIRFKEMGVDARLRGELIDYMKQLFPSPQNNWDTLR
jgi:cytochrome c553